MTPNTADLATTLQDMENFWLPSDTRPVTVVRASLEEDIEREEEDERQDTTKSGGEAPETFDDPREEWENEPIQTYTGIQSARLAAHGV